MFGGVGKTGEILHQLCHMVFHADEVMGSASARNLLANHPFLVRHAPPEDRGFGTEWDQYWFGRELKPFRFVVPVDREPDTLSIQFHGGDAFKGFSGIATGKGRYMVTLSQPLMGGFGAKAKPLAQWFIRKFDAIDTANPLGTR